MSKKSLNNTPKNIVPTYDELNIFQNNLETARRTLEYSLFLPEITILDNLATDDTIISQAISNCFQNCHIQLFKNTGYKFWCRHRLKSENIKQYIPIFLDENLSTDTKILEKDFWASTLLSDCIMASYDKVLSLLSFETVSPYALNKFDNLGFCKLKETNLINTLNERFPYQSLDEMYLATESQHSSAEASTLRQKIQTHKTDWNLGFLRKCEPIDNNTHIPLHSSQLLNNVLNIKAPSFHKLSTMYHSPLVSKENFPSKNWSHYCNTYKVLGYTNCRPIDFLDPAALVDQLHYYYQLENTFAFDLASFSIQSIKQLREEGHVYPDGINDYKILAQISRMPNVFSRNAYLQYALEFIRTKEPVHDSCFVTPVSPTSVVDRSETYKFDFNEWNIVLSRFCHFFNNLIFPAEEWYFFLTLYDTVKFTLSGQNCTIRDVLLKMQHLLATYINQNHSYLTKYWHCSNIESINPNDIEYDRKNPDISILLSAFCDANPDTELSLACFCKKNLMPPDNQDINHKRLLQFFTNIIAK